MLAPHLGEPRGACQPAGQQNVDGVVGAWAAGQRVLDSGDVFGFFDEAFAVQEAGDQVFVMPWRAHGQAYGVAIHTDLKGLFANEQIVAFLPTWPAKGAVGLGLLGAHGLVCRVRRC